MFKKFLAALLSSNLAIFLVLGALGHAVFNKKEMNFVFLNQSKEDVEEVFNFSLGKATFDRIKIRKVLIYHQMLSDYVPRPALVYANQGYCYFYLGEMDKAIDSYQKAIARLPGFYTFYFDLGMIYMVKQDYEKAWEYFNESMDMIAEERDQYLALLQVIKKQRSQLAQFYDDYDLMAARFDHDKRRNLYQLIEVTFRLNQFEEMKKIAYEGILIFPDDARFYYQAGRANLMLKNQEQALALFTEAINRQPGGYQEALYYRGLIYKEKGFVREALLDWQAAEKTPPRETPLEVEKTLDMHLFYDRGMFFVALSM